MRSSILALFAGIAAVAMASSDPEDLSMEEMVARGFVVEERGDTSDWMDLTVGVMVERSPVPGTSLTEGIERQELMVERDLDGSLKLPRSWEEGQAMAKRGLEAAVGHVKSNGMVKRALKNFSTTVTWYSGHDLLGPACVTHSSWHPTDNSLACAMAVNRKSSAGLKCGQFIKIKAPGGKKAVVCRLVDLCAGCADEKERHIDLTKKAFSTLFSLNKGRVQHLQAQIVGAPGGSWSVSTYGPKNL